MKGKRSFKKILAVLMAVVFTVSGITYTPKTVSAADYSELTYENLGNNTNSEFSASLYGSQIAIASGSLNISVKQYQNVAFRELYLALSGNFPTAATINGDSTAVTITNDQIFIPYAADAFTYEYNVLEMTFSNQTVVAIIYCPANAGKGTYGDETSSETTTAEPTTSAPEGNIASTSAWTSWNISNFASSDYSGYTITNSSIGTTWWHNQTWIPISFSANKTYTCYFEFTTTSPKALVVDNRTGDATVFTETAASKARGWINNGDGTYTYKYEGTYTSSSAANIDVRVSTGYNSDHTANLVGTPGENTNLDSTTGNWSGNNSITATLSNFIITPSSEFVEPTTEATTAAPTPADVTAVTASSSAANTLTATWTESASVIAGQQYEVYLDNAATPTTTVNAGVTSYTFTGVAAGSHTVTVKAKYGSTYASQAGVTSSSVTVNNANPEDIQSLTAVESGTKGAAIDVTFTASANATGTQQYKIYLDNTLVRTEDSAGTYTIDASAGTHTVKVTAYDANAETTETTGITVSDVAVTWTRVTATWGDITFGNWQLYASNDTSVGMMSAKGTNFADMQVRIDASHNASDTVGDGTGSIYYALQMREAYSNLYSGLIAGITYRMTMTFNSTGSGTIVYQDGSDHRVAVSDSATNTIERTFTYTGNESGYFNILLDGLPATTVLNNFSISFAVASDPIPPNPSAVSATSSSTDQITVQWTEGSGVLSGTVYDIYLDNTLIAENLAIGNSPYTRSNLDSSYRGSGHTVKVVPKYTLAGTTYTNTGTTSAEFEIQGEEVINDEDWILIRNSSTYYYYVPSNYTSNVNIAGQTMQNNEATIYFPFYGTITSDITLATLNGTDITSETGVTLGNAQIYIPSSLIATENTVYKLHVETASSAAAEVYFKKVAVLDYAPTISTSINRNTGLATVSWTPSSDAVAAVNDENTTVKYKVWLDGTEITEEGGLSGTTTTQSVTQNIASKGYGTYDVVVKTYINGEEKDSQTSSIIYTDPSTIAINVSSFVGTGNYQLAWEADRHDHLTWTLGNNDELTITGYAIYVDGNLYDDEVASSATSYNVPSYAFATGEDYQGQPSSVGSHSVSVVALVNNEEAKSTLSSANPNHIVGTDSFTLGLNYVWGNSTDLWNDTGVDSKWNFTFTPDDGNVASQGGSANVTYNSDGSVTLTDLHRATGEWSIKAAIYDTALNLEDDDSLANISFDITITDPTTVELIRKYDAGEEGGQNFSIGIKAVANEVINENGTYRYAAVEEPNYALSRWVYQEPGTDDPDATYSFKYDSVTQTAVLHYELTFTPVLDTYDLLFDISSLSGIPLTFSDATAKDIYKVTEALASPIVNTTDVSQSTIAVGWNTNVPTNLAGSYYYKVKIDDTYVSHNATLGAESQYSGYDVGNHTVVVESYYGVAGNASTGEGETGIKTGEASTTVTIENVDKPNFVISDIQVGADNTQYYVGDTVPITFKVKNIGTAAASYSSGELIMQVYKVGDSDTQIGSNIVATGDQATSFAVDAEVEYSVNYELTADDVGVMTIKVAADTDEAVAELSETDNTRTVRHRFYATPEILTLNNDFTAVKATWPTPSTTGIAPAYAKIVYTTSAGVETEAVLENWNVNITSYTFTDVLQNNSTVEVYLSQDSSTWYKYATGTAMADLIVSNLRTSGNDAQLSPGTAYTLVATVKNIGTAAPSYTSGNKISVNVDVVGTNYAVWGNSTANPTLNPYATLSDNTLDITINEYYWEGTPLTSAQYTPSETGEVTFTAGVDRGNAIPESNDNSTGENNNISTYTFEVVQSVEVVGFQMNTNTAEGGVSEIMPSFRVVSRAANTIGGSEVTACGTIVAKVGEVEEENINTTTMVLNPKDSNIRVQEASETGKITWGSKSSETDSQYFAMSLKQTNYNFDELEAKYAFRAYATLANGTTVYSDKIVTVSTYEIAENLYQNRKMHSLAQHNFLYHRVLNIVSMHTNRSKMGTAMFKALGISSVPAAGSDLRDYYDWVQIVVNDIQAYTECVPKIKGCEYGYTYQDIGNFVSKNLGENEAKLLAALNKGRNTNWSTLYEWLINEPTKIKNNAGNPYPGCYMVYPYDWDNYIYKEYDNETKKGFTSV